MHADGFACFLAFCALKEKERRKKEGGVYVTWEYSAMKVVASRGS